MDSSRMFLTDEEVYQLTGSRRRKGQAEVLRRNGIPFFIRADGWPVVTVAAVEGRPERTSPAEPEWIPNVLKRQRPT